MDPKKEENSLDNTTQNNGGFILKFPSTLKQCCPNCANYNATSYNFNLECTKFKYFNHTKSFENEILDRLRVIMKKFGGYKCAIIYNFTFPSLDNNNLTHFECEHDKILINNGKISCLQGNNFLEFMVYCKKTTNQTTDQYKLFEDVVNTLYVFGFLCNKGSSTITHIIEDDKPKEQDLQITQTSHVCKTSFLGHPYILCGHPCEYEFCDKDSTVVVVEQEVEIFLLCIFVIIIFVVAHCCLGVQF